MAWGDEIVAGLGQYAMSDKERRRRIREGLPPVELPPAPWPPQIETVGLDQPRYAGSSDDPGWFGRLFGSAPPKVTSTYPSPIGPPEAPPPWGANLTPFSEGTFKAFGREKDVPLGRMAGSGVPVRGKTFEEVGALDQLDDEARKKGRVVAALPSFNALSYWLGSAADDPTRNRVVTRPELAGDLRQNADYINRMPIAALGFDPQRITIDTKGSGINYKGITLGSPPYSMYSSADSPTTPVHESIHRGLFLAADIPGGKELLRKLPGQEMITRFLMHNQAEGVEMQEAEANKLDPEDIEKAIKLFDTSTSRGKQNYDNLMQLQRLVEEKLRNERHLPPI